MDSPRMPPTLTVEQMREVDRVMIEDLHITLMQMMENAGRHLAEVAMRQFAPHRVLVLAGSLFIGATAAGALRSPPHAGSKKSYLSRLS